MHRMNVMCNIIPTCYVMNHLYLLMLHTVLLNGDIVTLLYWLD